MAAAAEVLIRQRRRPWGSAETAPQPPLAKVSLTDVDCVRVVALAARLGVAPPPVMVGAVAAYVARAPLQCHQRMEDAMTKRRQPEPLNALQGDLLSGQWSSKPLRRGGGKHIPLKPLTDASQVAV